MVDTFCWTQIRWYVGRGLNYYFSRIAYTHDIYVYKFEITLHLGQMQMLPNLNC